MWSRRRILLSACSTLRLSSECPKGLIECDFLASDCGPDLLLVSSVVCSGCRQLRAPVTPEKRVYGEIRTSLRRICLVLPGSAEFRQNILQSNSRPLQKFRAFAGIFFQDGSLREYRDKRKKDSVSGPSINRNLAALRRMFNLARQENKLTTIPYFPMDAESRPDKLFLPAERFEKLRKAMPSNLRKRPIPTVCTECE
jgi:hypothetical protein